MNRAIIIGNLGRDPEVKALPSGQPVAEFSVATSRKWTDKQTNQRHEETEWHNVVAYGRTAEVAGQYLTKGAKVAIEGRIKTRSWEDRETGKRVYRTEIICDQLEMLGGKGEGGGAGAARADDSDTRPMSSGGDDDEIPF